MVLFSCGDKTIENSKPKKQTIRTSATLNQKITISDIKLALKEVLDHKLQDEKIPVLNNAFVNFCYLSPTIMLDNFVQHSYDTVTSEHKVLTVADKAYMLRHYRDVPRFEWKDILENCTDDPSWPVYKLSNPLFSIDKNKFII